jgi:hypothetical protein
MTVFCIVILFYYLIVNYRELKYSLLGNQIGVDGVSNLIIKSVPEIGHSVNYTYKSKGRTFEATCYPGQTGIECNIKDESGNEINLPFTFDDTQSQTDASKDKLFIAQHDFDFDGIDELIIGYYGKEEHTLLQNGVSLIVAKLSQSGWVLLKSNQNSEFYNSIISAENIIGNLQIKIIGNKITIPRNHRGFYYQWDLESGRFVNTGFY